MATPTLTPAQVKKTKALLDRKDANPAELDPLSALARQYLAKLAAAFAQRQQLSAKLVPLIQPLAREVMHNFLYDVWAVQVTSALATAEMPEDEVSSWYAFAALAGNLVWAATCLEPATWAIKVMSFGGAAVGSGFFTPGKDSGPNGKDLVGTAIARALDAADKTIPLRSSEAARQLALVLPDTFDDATTTDADRYMAIEAFVWNMMFPKLDYEHKNEAIRDEASDNIAKALKVIKKAWGTWISEAWRWRAGRAGVFGTIGMPGPELYAAYSKAGHPFRPDIGSAITSMVKGE